jgi:LmbE family N-acetylglucosaminyl deacetylase
MKVSDLDMVLGVGEVVDRVRPDTIVTFGPEGMTGHPAHRTVCGCATAAWGGFPAPVAAESELAFVFTCDADTRTRKLAALEAHRTQTPGIIARVGTDAFRHWWAEEGNADAIALSTMDPNLTEGARP